MTTIRPSLLFATVASLLFVTPALAQERVDNATLARIRAEGTERSRVLEVFGQLTTVIGPRLAGTPAYNAAAAWSRDWLAQRGLANAHLEHRSRSAALRGSQVEAILGWLKDSNDPAVIAGDFNDVPDSPALAAFRPGFRSIFSGREVQLVGTSPAREPHRIIDYIMAIEGVEVLDAGKFVDEPRNGRWASDHIGLWAKLRI